MDVRALSSQECDSAFHSIPAADVIEGDQTTPWRVDVRNQCDDDGDENWKNESLKNRVTPGSSRRVTNEPQAATRYAQQQQPDSAGHMVAFGCDTLSL
jgi:hypothetical protein